VVNFYKFLNFKIEYDLSKKSSTASNGIAAVVGSNHPSLSISLINLVEYGIRVSVFFDLGHLRLIMELFYPLFLALNVSK